MRALPASSLLRLLLLGLPLAATGCFAAGPMPWQTSIASTAPRLFAGAGCSLWQGSVSGNDPSVGAELELCPVGDDSAAVHGRIQLTSESSGWSVRAVEGHIEPDGTVLLREVRFDVSEPEFGWMFCLVDRYELRPVGPERLSGHYDSRACKDHARVDLVRSP